MSNEQLTQRIGHIVITGVNQIGSAISHVFKGLAKLVNIDSTYIKVMFVLTVSTGLVLAHLVNNLFLLMPVWYLISLSKYTEDESKH